MQISGKRSLLMFVCKSLRRRDGTTYDLNFGFTSFCAVINVNNIRLIP
jgi:hypothetical protein